MNSFTEYINKLRKNIEKGDSTEHTHRTALEALLEACDEDIDATNEPRRIACGAPDFNITRKGVPVGHVETKDVGVNLDEMERGKGPNGEQFKRYSMLPNWILTDYLEFRWYAAGQKRLTVRVADFDGKGRLKITTDGGKDENVFDITVGVSILLAVRLAETELPSGRQAPARVFRSRATGICSSVWSLWAENLSPFTSWNRRN
jgi:hypothetical protein